MNVLGNYIKKNCQLEVSVMEKLLVRGDLTIMLREFIQKLLGGVKSMQSARNVRLNMRVLLNIKNKFNVLNNHIKKNCQIEVSVMVILLVRGDLRVTLREFFLRS